MSSRIGCTSGHGAGEARWAEVVQGDDEAEGTMTPTESVTPDEWADDTPTLFAAMARHAGWIVTAVVASVVVVFVLSSSRPPTYAATSTVFLATSNPLTGEAIDVRVAVAQEAARLSAPAVYRRASAILDSGPTAEDLRRLVTIDGDAALGSVAVIAPASDATDAATIANAVTEAYRQLTRQAVDDQIDRADDVLADRADALVAEADRLDEQLNAGEGDATTQRRLDTVQRQLDALQERMSEVTVDAALSGTGIASIEEAVAPTAPARPKPVRDSAVAGLLALAIASAVAYWRAGSGAGRRLDASALLGAPMLAQVPAFPGGTWDQRTGVVPDSAAAEAYQFLLASLEFVMAQRAATSILVTSPHRGDGKSSTALHLAHAFARQGRHVVLVDADIRGRGLTTLLGAGDQQGLLSLTNGRELDAVVQHVPLPPSDRLAVVPTGPVPEHPTGLLANPRHREAIAKIIANNELTIIDGGSLLDAADASAVAAQVDGILLVLDAAATDDELLEVQDRLRLVPTPLLGYVVNRVLPRDPSGRTLTPRW